MSGLIIVHKPYQVGDHLFLNLNGEVARAHKVFCGKPADVKFYFQMKVYFKPVRLIKIAKFTVTSKLKNF